MNHEQMPALSRAEIDSRAKAVVSDYLSSLDVEEREVVFALHRDISDGKVTLTGKTSDSSLKQALLDRLASIPGVKVVDEFVVLPAPSLGEKVFAIVKVPVADLGDGPNSSAGSHRVTQARMGDVLRLLEEQDKWYLAQMDDDYLGWIGPESIFVCDEDYVKSLEKSRVALVIAKTTAMLDGPDGNPVLPQDLVQGSVLPVTGVNGGWMRLCLPGGSEGWVPSEDLEEYGGFSQVFSEKKGPEAVIRTAERYVGLPYLWGGTSAYGFDCSGLTQFAMKMNGYRIRRDAHMQYEQGEPIDDRKDLKPGDLVFFETYAEGPSHVGIYMGDSLYIQSGGSTGLTIQSFDPSDPRYSDRLDKAYLGARRIIK